jgi:hypothetical protein
VKKINLLINIGKITEEKELIAITNNLVLIVEMSKRELNVN